MQKLGRKISKLFAPAGTNAVGGESSGKDVEHQHGVEGTPGSGTSKRDTPTSQRSILSPKGAGTTHASSKGPAVEASGPSRTHANAIHPHAGAAHHPPQQQQTLGPAPVASSSNRRQSAAPYMSTDMMLRPAEGKAGIEALLAPPGAKPAMAFPQYFVGGNTAKQQQQAQQAAAQQGGPPSPNPDKPRAPLNSRLAADVGAGKVPQAGSALPQDGASLSPKGVGGGDKATAAHKHESAAAPSIIKVAPSSHAAAAAAETTLVSRIPSELNPGRKNQVLSLSPNIPVSMTRKYWSLSEYSIVRKMYTGYASTVYQATCKRSLEQVALKVYHMENLCELNHFQVYREIRVHAALRHQNIIHLYAAFQEGTDVVLVQEYAEGGDLYRLLHKNGGRLSERQAVEMVLHPFLLSLHYLHTRGIMHRDIKPENVLFTDQRVLKLADFGLAIDLNEERAVTRAGTLDYMAPEVLRCPPKNLPQENKEKSNLYYNNSVDAWAVGVFAYELVVGFPPFAGDTQLDSVNNIMHQATPEFPEKMSELAKLFITQALKKHPGDRPTVMEMLHHPWIRSYQRRASTLHMPVSAARRGSAAAYAVPEVPPYKGGGGGAPSKAAAPAAAVAGAAPGAAAAPPPPTIVSLAPPPAGYRAPEPTNEDMSPEQIEDMIKKLMVAKQAAIEREASKGGN